MTIIAPDIRMQWMAIAPILTIRNEQEYDQSVDRLNALIDEIGTNEAHPLYTLLDTLGTVIQAYEDAHHTVPDCSGAEALAYLMEEHAIDESSLPEIGSAGTVRNVLSGNQTLEVEQIRALSQRFHVSPSVFI